jgi:hypothetical protein
MNKVLLFISVVLISCKTSYLGDSIEGKFINNGKDHNYSLILKSDYTFIYKRHDLDVLRFCSGRWYYINQDTILIQCEEENILQQITTGYLQERENKVIIVSQKKIKIDKLFFKKEPSSY